MTNAKWFGLSAMWLSVTGMLSFAATQTGELYWWVIFIPALITFAAVGSKVEQKKNNG